MKTAVQIILERAQDGINCHEKAMDNPKNSNIEKNRYSYLLNVCIMFKNLAIEQLETEKQQIIEAYSDGMGRYGDANSRSEADKYYNDTYNNQ